jgi:drug/metabolite transporter (DMT)-like permease
MKDTYMWFFYALLSGIFYTISNLVSRHVLKGAKDAWAFSFFFSFFGALASIPFMIASPKYAHSVGLWIVMILVGILIVSQNLLNFKSTNYLEASLQGAVSKIRLVWVLLLGIILLGESFTLYKAIGTIFTVIAGVLIVWRNIKIPKSARGVLFAFSATFFYATVIMLYKYLFRDFNSQTLTFFIFFIPAIINIIIMPHSITRIKNLWQQNRKAVTMACIAGGLANLAMNQALAIGEASKVLVMIESFLVIVLVGEHLFLKERKDMAVKIVSVLLATAGAILIRLS